MSHIIRYTPARLVAPIASSSRALSTTLPSLAAVKGKGAKPTLKKAAHGRFSRKSTAKVGPAASGNEGGAGKSSGLTLRYSMANDLPDLSDFIELHPESYTIGNIGKPTAFPRKTFQKIRIFELPSRVEKELGLSGTPSSVVRQTTLESARILDRAKDRSSKDSRYILTGERGSGKSMLLLQTVSYALESGWIVLYVPRTTRWIDSSSPYAYDATSKTFHQPEIAQTLLQHLSKVNNDKLSQLKLSKRITLSSNKNFNAGISVSELIDAGLRDEGLAITAFEAVLEVLAEQTQFPILLAIDEVQALFKQSTYRSSDYKPLEAYHLSAPRLSLEYITGRKSFKRGSILTSLSYSSPSYLPPTPLLAGLNLKTPLPLTPQTILDPQHLENASSGIKHIPVEFGMTIEEAAGMFEIWGRKGWAPSLSDELFLGAYTASAGNPQEFAKGLLKTQQAFNVR